MPRIDENHTCSTFEGQKRAATVSHYAVIRLQENSGNISMYIWKSVDHVGFVIAFCPFCGESSGDAITRVMFKEINKPPMLTPLPEKICFYCGIETDTIKLHIPGGYYGYLQDGPRYQEPQEVWFHQGCANRILMNFVTDCRRRDEWTNLMAEEEQRRKQRNATKEDQHSRQRNPGS